MKVDIIRAWKDAEYRASLSEAERANLPDNPAGTVALTGEQLRSVTGGTFYTASWPNPASHGCCHMK